MTPSLAALETMPHGEFLELVHDVLLSEADRIRQSQEAIIRAGWSIAWDDGQRFRWATMRAAAHLVLQSISAGQDAKTHNKAPPASAITASNMLRFSLVNDIRQNLGITKAENEEGAHATAAE